MELRVHIISHTHWDREWFLSSDYTNKWLVPFFERLFSLLESNDRYRFVLDGQMQMVYDYLQELSEDKRKEAENLLRKYGVEGRLLFGPYWAQVDWRLSGSESIVRNLLLGSEYAERFGNRMRVGWLLDVFGQIGQTPQLHLLSGIDSVFIWRGVEFPDDDLHSEFFWVSPDGSEVITSYFFDSYRNLMGLTLYPEIAALRIRNEVEKMRPFLVSPNVLLMNGYDLDTYPEDPFTVIKDEELEGYKLCQSDGVSYMNSVKEGNPELSVLKGELLSGRYLCVFPGTLSTRVYLKLWNYYCEYMLRGLVEPIGAISWYFTGFYPDEEVRELWKNLISNEIHDNIAGVCVDQVHTLMEERYKEIFDKATDLLERLLSKISGGIPSNSVVVFNTNLFEIDLPVEAGGKLFLLKSIPPLGYRIIDNKDSQDIHYSNEEIDGFSWENDFYAASFNADGTLDVYDKTSGRSFKRLGYLYDEADGGDEYNYSPVTDGSEFTTVGNPAKFNLLYRTPFSAKVSVETSFEVPEKLEDGFRSKKITALMVRYEVLFDNTPLIKYRMFVDNTAKDHRLKIAFPSPIKDGKIIAEMPFEYAIRPCFIDNSRPIPSSLERLLIGARECGKEYAFPMKDFVSLVDEDGHISVMAKGISEYEVRGSTLYITLLRSVGWIAKTGIKSRVGDAGPEMYTPEAQCLRRLEYNLAVFVGNRKFYEKTLTKWVQIFHNPPLVVKVDHSKGNNENLFSLLSFRNTKVKLTAVKVSEDRKGIILRVYHPERKINILKLPEDVDCFETDLLENEVERVSDYVEIRPSEILTLKFIMKPLKVEYSGAKITILSPYIHLPLADKLSSGDPEPEIIKYMEEKMNSLSNRLNEIEEILKKESGLKYHELKFEFLRMKRTYLELKLSYLLNMQKAGKDGLKKEIGKVGKELNDLRIQRRAYEYILDYWKATSAKDR